ncbi:MAG: ABC transporter substrate-binding protein [Deltaproteobacteria bacterium]|jgi:iron complex transport system substrate-binding protein|nr:ABC transporter substrate-binding protein [Deltaproteobacteria bacterium]
MASIIFRRSLLVLVALMAVISLLLGWLLSGASTLSLKDFEQPGSQLFAKTTRDGYEVVTDAWGRQLALTPLGQNPPPGWPLNRVIRTPPRRLVVATGFFDVGLLCDLGFGSSIIGVTKKESEWLIPAIREGLANERIAFLGTDYLLDFEKIHALKPDLIFGPGGRTVNIFDEMPFPSILTYSSDLNDLGIRLKFVDFLGHIFQAPEASERFRRDLRAAFHQVQAIIKDQAPTPVMWGTIFEKRFFVEPGDNWIGQILSQIGGDYLFSHVRGDSTSEVSLESFIERGQRAEVLFLYPPLNARLTDKKDLLALNPLLGRLKPLSGQGRVYLSRTLFYQSFGRLNEIVLEMGALLHPDLFPPREILFFEELL